MHPLVIGDLKQNKIWMEKKIYEFLDCVLRTVNDAEVFIVLSQWDLEISFIIHFSSPGSFSNLCILELIR